MWGWLKPLFGFLGKILGVGLLINHGKTKQKLKEAEKENELRKKLAKVDVSAIADDDIDGML